MYAIAGAMSIAFIGLDQDNQALVFSLMIGAVFWNYLSTVFGYHRGDRSPGSAGRARSSTR